MTAAQALVAFTVLWWLVFFMALPFGVRPEAEPLPGNVESAPARPRLGLKALVATAAAALLTGLAHLVIDSGAVSLRPPPSPPPAGAPVNRG